MKTILDALVETSWLADNLDDGNIRIIEIDTSPLPRVLRKHIPGSILIDWKKDLWDPARRDFITGESFAKLMERAEIFNDSTVVCCSQVRQFATYAYWILRYNNHRKVAVLNGGLEKWIFEGRPVEDKPGLLRSTSLGGYVHGRVNTEIRVYRDYVLKNLQRKDVVLLDARSPQEYEGKLINVQELPQEGSLRAGRIPGAKNIYFEDNIAPDGCFKSVDELRELYSSRDIRHDKEIIVYCRMGHRATLVWFVLSKILGFPNVRVYDGSWTEWGNLVNVPIEL
jgi:thiosulfate/3-mercaptopyruvate sulfurtransferase